MSVVEELADLKSDFGVEVDGDKETFIEGPKFFGKVLPLELRRRRLPVAERDPGLHDEDPELALGDDVTLWLMCGLTPAPLLLSVALARPRRIVLVRSEGGEGKKSVHDLREALSSQGFEDASDLRAMSDVVVAEVVIDGSDPGRAYRSLLDAFAEHGATPETAVFDITGGKKTMVQAATLACSRRRVPTRYVDFREYDVDRGIPVPGTSVVRRLTDPVFILRERELDLVRKDFNGERYASAIRGLGEALSDLKKAAEAGYLDAAEVERHARRLRYAEGAAAWAEQRYGEAVERLGGECPTAVRGLGAALRAAATARSRMDRLLAEPGLLTRFVADERSRSTRKLTRGEDLSGVFLRLFSLVESCVRARLWQVRALAFGVEDPTMRPLEIDAKGKSFTRPTCWPAPVGMSVKLLLGGEPEFDDAIHIKLSDVPSLAELAPLGNTGPGNWGSLRNDCAHNLAEVDEAQVKEFANLADAMLDALFDAMGASSEWAGARAIAESEAPKTWDEVA